MMHKCLVLKNVRCLASRRPKRRQSLLARTLFTVALACLAGPLSARPAVAVEPFVDVTPRHLPILSPGTRVTDRVEGWSHLLMIAEPTLAGGDVDQLDPLAQGLAGRFNLVLAADVRRNTDGSFYLRSLGCGLAVKNRSEYVVVSSERSPGVNLGFIERMVLDRSEDSLKTATQFARTLHLAVFDAKAIVLADGQHRDWYMRHAVLVHPASGKVSLLVWFLEPKPGQDDQLHLPSSAIRMVEVGMTEKRALHVDKRHFALGFPTDRAFALMQLPKGHSIEVREELLPLFTSRRLDADSVAQLQAALEQIVAQQR